MPGLPRQIEDYAATLPEGAPLCPNALLHLGNRAAVDQALSRLARRGRLMRICQGVYMRPVETRFGECSPAIERVIPSLSKLWGEVIVPCGGGAANVLGLTTQVPVQLVYLTSGPSRKLWIDGQPVVLRHAPRWQLVAPNRLAGNIVRALAWLGPEEVDDGLDRLAPRISDDDLAELASARAVLPAWLAEPISRLVARA
ncbi:MAG: type IV toxin-antitoxin system AbiEi family antitoxin domain-containing protein [Acidobacteriia bacterium]|nr:type IV toxin-antitoxin system AbiEi family antitoxin domain-containing protein [Terriglobia bacterium]MYC67080.1 type IV toxin-antitoxin system AbiEi family antitoxin domain-containing protein [Terriglobia bacterium]